MELEKLKFPIGKYTPDKNPTPEKLALWIKDIEAFPERVVKLLEKTSTTQRNYAYRPNGWTVNQVIHHCADSHMNSIIRFKLALTEKTPTIRPYFEDRWAELADAKSDDIQDSLLLLKSLHKKWIFLLKNLTENELQLEFIHPEHGQKFNIAENIGTYAWHCNHHLAHIKNGLLSEGKYN